MAAFKSFQLHHTNIGSLNDIRLNDGKHYIVFYYKNIPLGHLYLESDSILSMHYSAVFEAICPAVRYYAGQSGMEVPDIIRENFVNGDPEALLFLLEKTNINPPALETNTISVIVCTRNRPDAIVKCVSSLMASSDKDFELIVVDNAASDDLTEKRLDGFPSVKYIPEPRKGLDIARNTGARHATGSIIAYTDDDVAVSKDWIAQLRTCFNDPMTMAVTGLVMPEALHTEAQYTFEKDWGFNRGYVPLIFDHQYFKKHYHHGIPTWEVGAGANMAFRRQAFQIAGYFDERLDVGASGCSGDSEMWYRILAEGWTCRYFPHLYVHHQHRESKKELNRQLFAYMRGNISSILVQYEKYGHPGERQRVYRAIPKYYLKKLRTAGKKLQFAALTGLFHEISGAISGWWFYQKNKYPMQAQKRFFSLYDPVEIHPDDLVSVIIPCYNHARYLPAAISSVRNQSYPNTEIIVVDDGSTDETEKTAKSFTNVLYLKTNRVGLSAARNLGVSLSKAAYVIFLDADDFLMPGAIQAHLEQLAAQPYAAFVSGAHHRVNAQGKPISSPDPVFKSGDCYQDLLQGNFIAMEGTVLYRRKLFEAFSFDPRLSACEDYDLNLRITRHFPTITHENISAGYRIHEENMSKNTAMMLEQALKTLEKQIPFLKNLQERKSYEQGVLNWKNYYTQKKAE